MKYFRLQSQLRSPYTQRNYGLFVAVWHLIRDKKVSPDEETAYWEHRSWFEANLPVPPFYKAGNPDRAVTWFIREAIDDTMQTRLSFYLQLGEKYGLELSEETADELEGIIYEDVFQVAVALDEQTPTMHG